MASELGIYGNVVIKRGYCQACDAWALVLDGRLLCCDAPCEDAPARYRRIVEPEQVRRPPSMEHQRRVLDQQGGMCLYCDHPFGDFVERRGKLIRLYACWDHQCPWIYSQDNSDENFVAACQLCNAWKYSQIFNSVEAVREFVAHHWANANEALPRLRRRVPARP